MSDDIALNIKVVGDEYKQALLNMLLEMGGVVEGRAVSYAPADTGNLRGGSFTTLVDDTVVVGFTAEYAAAVHDMTPKHAGEPRRSGSGKGAYWDNGRPEFLQDALDELEPAIIERLANVRV